MNCPRYASEEIGKPLAKLPDDFYNQLSNIRALGELKSEKAVESLIETLKGENEKIRRESALALLRIKSKKAIGPLTEAFQDEDWEVRFYATEALKAIREGNSQYSD